jgi:predicted flavoprotein YhiN
MARMGERVGPDAAENALAGFLHKRIMRLVAKAETASPVRRLAAALKRWSLPIVGTQGFDRAQATLGGIDLAGFHLGTLESKLVPGLFAAGEILDVVGDCGGFNLHWAWASGYAAGQGSAAI